MDGCHLKSKLRGKLSCAIGRDANDNMLPIAWAVVEIENKDSWKWFLTLLLKDIGSVEDMGWTFMSDQQKVNVNVHVDFPFLELVYNPLLIDNISLFCY